MKAKKLLYLAILAGILVSTIAVPVLAEGDAILMWVHRARLNYIGRCVTEPDQLVALIHIRDAENDMVEGAKVIATWTPPVGPTFSESELTGAQGFARFSLWAGKGTYTFCVTDVIKDGWQYDETLDRERCATFTAR